MIGMLIDLLSKIKELLRNNECHALPIVIVRDLIKFGKLPIFLFICIIFTAITVIIIVHYTRLLTTQREQLALEYNALDIEWRNLILEENVLNNHSRIERIATKKLQLQHVNSSQENIIVK